MKYVTKQCFVCKSQGTVELPDTNEAQQALDDWLDRKILIQQGFPDLSAEVREQMISGTHPDCWVELFGEDDEEPLIGQGEDE